MKPSAEFPDNGQCHWPWLGTRDNFVATSRLCCNVKFRVSATRYNQNRSNNSPAPELLHKILLSPVLLSPWEKPGDPSTGFFLTHPSGAGGSPPGWHASPALHAPLYINRLSACCGLTGDNPGAPVGVVAHRTPPCELSLPFPPSCPRPRPCPRRGAPGPRTKAAPRTWARTPRWWATAAPAPPPAPLAPARPGGRPAPAPAGRNPHSPAGPPLPALGVAVSPGSARAPRSDKGMRQRNGSPRRAGRGAPRPTCAAARRAHLVLPLAAEAQARRPLLVALPVVRPRLVRLEFHHRGGDTPATPGRRRRRHGSSVWAPPPRPLGHRRGAPARERGWRKASPRRCHKSAAPPVPPVPPPRELRRAMEPLPEPRAATAARPPAAAAPAPPLFNRNAHSCARRSAPRRRWAGLARHGGRAAQRRWPRSGPRSGAGAVRARAAGGRCCSAAGAVPGAAAGGMRSVPAAAAAPSPL